MYAQVANYIHQGIYPFHMPGHKRNGVFLPGEAWGLDITEVPGMDVLSRAEGILHEMQRRIAHFWGAGESLLLVNGSTSGILAAIFAAREAGYEVELPANAHISAVNAMKIAPQGSVQAGRCHFVVRPTYEGLAGALACGVCIVDEAHGAHFPFHSAFPGSAVSLGADIVVTSLHKTLPCPGQMAVLHISPTCRIDPARVKFYVNALTTTSPSYMLLAATDFALAKLWREPHLFDDYVQRLRNFRTQMPRENAPLTLVETDDIGKLFFKINADIDIQKALHDDYKIEIEAATPTHFLCMTSVADTDEGFSRLRSAMHELNDTLPYAPKPASTEIFAHPAYF